MFLLVAALLSCCAVPGGASDESVPMKILASAGGTVILPCHINVSGDIPEVEWSKEGQHPEIAFLYRHGCETYEMKDLVFQYRTNLFMNELKNGNVSLRISNVRLSDAGKYICKTLQKPPQEVVTWELVVGEVSEPVLSIVEFADAGVTLQCEAKCWFPEPEITFLSEQGNISAENPRSDPDSRGCFNVKRRVTVQAAARFRVTCRVHQPEMNQTRVTVIYIPAGEKPFLMRGMNKPPNGKNLALYKDATSSGVDMELGGLTDPVAWRLTLVVLVLLAADTPAAGQSQVIGSLRPIVAAPGDDVILPCHVEPGLNVVGLTVEWSKPDVQPDPDDRLSRVEYVHLYRDAREDPDMKMSSYVRRTRLSTDGLRHGNISLKIINVTLADEGRYKCLIPKLKSRIQSSIVYLVVEPNSAKTWTTETPLQTRCLQTTDPKEETDVEGAEVV
ncbi:butyrophilin-like protein 2 [Enoplosus armatus]|uniref:butyrophilin-like protein 2 n=1 Tax=Enoplosus armatus TaxID=215367 RepID=UPI0039940F0F